ncbi:MAG: NifU family protein [Candidatus Zixiibacteriota bacterium]
MTEQEIKITAQLFPDPDVCIFRVDRPVFPGGAFDCKNKEAAAGSPLLEALFELKGIREVFVTGDSITISKDSDEEWQVLGREVGRTVRELIKSGKQLVAEDARQPVPPDDEIKRIVDEMFENEINPAIASHGGFVECVAVKNGQVMLRLAGGCQGCASSSMTLRHGIERSIRDRIPGVGEVIDVTDHSAGVNPYY